MPKGHERTCCRRDLEDCPYRGVDEDDFLHWTRAGMSAAEVEKRSRHLCLSVPCLYIIEMKLDNLREAL